MMENKKQDGRSRKNIQIGSNVEIVQKQDQRTGQLTSGVVQRILTNSATHPHGIKVRLQSGEVGRVKNVLV
jgi:uncharacterized repeat protein (TIGR03833 family)